jgi:acyl-CoA dehydrogenase
MNVPGVSVEPLIAFNGKRLWNQVFFDDVRTPKTNRLGEENQGWTVAKNLLGNERLLVSRVAENRRILSRILDVISRESEAGVEFDGELNQQLTELQIRLEALEFTALRLLTQFDSGATIGAEPSMLKLEGSQLVQDMDRLLFNTIGYYGLPIDSAMREEGALPIGSMYSDRVANGLIHHRGYTIAGGSSEVQHNIIAQAVLGL